MKNLNLKEFFGSTVLAFNHDGRTTVERRSNDGHIRRHLPVGLTKLLSLFLLLTLGVGQMWGANFTNGEVIFIYANENSAWDASACVKAWFHNSGNSAVATNWLFDKGKEKMFYCVVPSSGSYAECQLQRFASNCSDWYNSNGDIKASDRTSGYNTFYSNGSGTSNCGWKGTYTMYLKGSTDSWVSNLATFTFSSGTTFTATYDFTAAATSYEFKMCDSYGNWHGSNVSVTGLVAGATYRFTGTINLASGIGSLSMSKTQLTFAIATSGTNGSVSPTSAFAGSSGVGFTATPNTGYHWSSWATTTGLSATNANPTSLTATQAGTLTANFAANTYTIAYNANDAQYPGTATGSTSSSSHTYGTAKALTSNGFSRAGYTFAGWNTKADGSGTSYTDGQSVTNLTSTHGATVTLYAKWTENKSTITLDASPSGKGTFQVGGVTVTTTQAGVTTTPAVTAVPIPGYSFSGWSITGGATISSTSANPTTVTGAGAGTAATLTATFVEDLTYYDVTFAVGTGYTSLGSLSATNTTTSASITSGDDIVKGTSITFTATPNTGYVVEGWYTDAACTSGKHNAGSNTYSTTLSGNITVYVKFVEKTWSVAFAAGTGGSVTTPATTPQTVGQVTGISIAATPATGYTFNSWSSSSGGSFTSGTSTNSNTFKPTANTTVTASFNETKSTITVATATSSQGSLKFGGTSKSWGATTSVGVATEQSITATAAAGFTFVRWDLSGAAATSSSTTSATITLKADGSGSTGTATAVFEEDLSSQWHLVGEDVASKVTFPNGWTVDNTSMMQKATGHSTESVVYANVTVSNADGTYEFKVVDDKGTSADIWYGYSTGDTYLTWTATSTKNVYSGDGNSNNLKFTPTVAGTYVFKVDYSGTYPAVTITYPVSYTLTYGIGTVKGNNGSISTSPSTSSGSKVISGTNITLTGPAAKSGYTWKGWYTNAAGTEGKIPDTDRAITVTMNANKTLYACYTENDYTVTVTAGEGGTVASTSVTGHKDTNVTLPTATPNSGYYFTGWTTTTGTVTYTNQTSASSAQVKGLTAAATVQANFAPIWRLVGSMNSWNEGTNPLLNYSTGGGKNYVDVEVSLNANTQYSFKIKDVQNSKMYKPTSSNTEITYANKATAQGMNNTADGNPNQTIMTAAAGTYRFTWNITDKSIKVTYPTSYKVTFGKGTGGASISASGSTTGAITSGEYVANGENVTFTQTASTGYTFAGWYTAASDGSAVATMGADDNILNSIAADATVYSRYTENMTTVALSATNGKIQCWDGDSWEDAASVNVGVATNCSIKAVPATGYYFAGWVNTEGTDYEIIGSFNVEANNNTTLKGKGSGETTGQTLTANFVELDKIYFRNWNEDANAALWENVYVYFGISWNGDNRPIASSTASNIVQMEQIGTSNIYWAYVPRAEYTNSNIAFSNHQFTTGYTFYQYESVKWGSYNRKLNMCVPKHGDKETIDETLFYKSYWKNYGLAPGAEAGYYMKRLNSSSNGYVDAATDCKFVVVDENTITYNLRVDNTGTGYQNKYMVSSAGGISYITSPASNAVGTAITTNACTDVNMTQYDAGTPRFLITPTSEGNYVITIDQSGDVMKISVNYPISEGDYRLKHTYNDGSAKTTYSDIIKAGTTETTVSMYINTTNTPTLALEKCTDLSPLTWTDQGAELSISTEAGKFDDGNGVYQFVFAAPGSTNGISDIKLYDGPYYIKADSLPGNWAAYKANVMTKNSINFDPANPTTYDYYMCHWYGTAGTNVKCVVANEYNHNLCDTLKTDDIVTGTPEVLPATANVRFSYNSVTNTLKRTYLNGSANWEDKYLLLEGDAKIRSFKTHAAYPGNDTTMVDNNNWTYVLDLEAQGGAEVKLSANYHNTKQWLIGGETNTVQILGGTDTNWASLRIVYDFKTNHLLSAWLVPASGTTPAKTLNTSVMVLRENQNDAHEITFADASHALSAVDTVYSALHFTYDYLTNQTKTVHERTFYWISFPYDVKVSDIFGSVGNYMEEWGILYYDGKQRAKNGMWIDSPSCWKYMAADDTLHAFEGYVAEIDLALIGTERNKGRWINNVTDLCLYFPSNGKVNTIVSKDITISIDQTDYLCKIDRTGNNGSDFNKNRTIADSYWHCLGVPSFAKKTHSTSDGWTGTYPTLTNWETDHMPYVYEYNGATNSYNVVSATNYEFKPMRSYLTQFNATSLTWSSVTAPATPSSVAARRAPQGAETDTEFRLTLMQDAQEVDRTFVRLCDDENVTAGFEFNYDLCKEMKTGANVYTIVSNYLPVAGNCLPMNNQTTIVPVGVKITANGEYTFAMPEGTNGTGVTLIDNETGTRTSLALTDYTVTLAKGTYDNRFVLEFSPVAQTPTGIEDAETVNRKSSNRKLLIDGILYIVKDGQVFDARGTKVK